MRPAGHRPVLGAGLLHGRQPDRRGTAEQRGGQDLLQAVLQGLRGGGSRVVWELWSCDRGASAPMRPGTAASCVCWDPPGHRTTVLDYSHDCSAR